MEDTTRSLDTTNPEHIGYRFGEIEVTVLGGIRLEGLDRMRVTLKIQVEHLGLRHSLDLYNDNQLEKLVRKVADKLEVGTSVTTAALNDLTDLLENYRLEEIERQNLREDKRKVLTTEEIKVAQSYLSARTAFTLRLNENLSNDQIANRMNISKGTVEHYMMRTLKHLRSYPREVFE